MPSIKYLGPTTNDIDVLNRIRLQTEISGTLTPSLVDQQITDALASKANSYYLGNESSKYATTSALSGRGDSLINISTQVNTPGHPVVLQGGRIPSDRLPRERERTGGRGARKLNEYNADNFGILHGVHSSTTERVIGTFTLNGPNHPWFPIFSGDFTMTGGKGEVCIKQGSNYLARAISGNHTGASWTCNIIPTQSLRSYTGSVSFSITQRAFFDRTELSAGYRMTCLAIPA